MMRSHARRGFSHAICGVVAVSCLVAATPPVEGAWLSIVNLDTWQGGEPTQEDLRGVTLGLGQTARLGIVLELMDGTYEDTGAYVENRVKNMIMYLDVLRWPQSVRVLGVQFHALNDAGELWLVHSYPSQALSNWLANPGGYPTPFLDSYAISAYDQPGGFWNPGHTGVGNSYSGNRIILVSEIVIEAVTCCDQVGSVVFSTSLATIGNGAGQAMLPQFGEFRGHGGHSIHARAGYLYLRNGRSQFEGFDIEIEPGQGGACCEQEGACRHLSEDFCRAQGGRFYGVGKACATQVAEDIIVEPGGDIFAHAIGVKLDCPEDGRSVQCEDRPYHVDTWVSDPHEAMCHQFGVAGSPPLPPGFFGPGSLAWSGAVCLRGAPLGVTSHGFFGEADTLIYRPQDPFAACEAPGAETRSTAIRPLALRLESIQPVIVSYQNGDIQAWNLSVDLSATYFDADTTNDPPWGTLWATKAHCNGGTYTSLLPIQPRFRFTRADAPSVVRELDTGLAGIAPVLLDARTMPRPWVSRIGDTLSTGNPVCSDFHPGLRETEVDTHCDCNSNAVHDACEPDCDENQLPDACDIALNPALDCNVNGVPDECDLVEGTSSDLNANQVPDECECLTDSDCPPTSFCAGPMQCVNNACRPGGSPCAVGQFCDEINDACLDCVVDSNCIDADFCNGVERCVGGACVAGDPPCAALGMECHEGLDRCVQCLSTADCVDDLYCTGVENCVNHECRTTGPPCGPGWVCDEGLETCVCDDDGDCADGLFCTGLDRCMAGVCVSAGDPCVAADLFCSEEADGCVECLASSHCNDGRFCSGVEACVAGECRTTGDPCTPLGLVCDPAADACRCDDDGDCADGLYCNGVDRCAGGFCVHDGDPCTAGGQYCVESFRECVDCVINAHCTDGLFCNGGEVCLENECYSVGSPCESMGLDCDEAGDRCTCNDDGDCSDGNYCNGVERCQNGSCLPGANPCLAQGLACDESLDLCYECRHTADCNDGQVCNGFETCAAGRCIPGEDPCGEGTHCSEATQGCVACTLDQHCDDGLFCNGVEHCASGQCVSGTGPCPAGRCDEAGDACLPCVSDDDCDDGLFCNGPERCVANACVGGDAPCEGQPCSEVSDACVACTARIHCDDGDDCTEDACRGFVCEHVIRGECRDEQAGRGPDTDGDGVPDGRDDCPGTWSDVVDERGCSCDQLDPDGDGISDCFDECPGTPIGESADSAGCTAAQRDADGDGVANATDACPDTPRGVAIDVRGCAIGQAPAAADGAEATAGRSRSSCGMLGWLPLAGLAGLLALRGARRVSRGHGGRS